MLTRLVLFLVVALFATPLFAQETSEDVPNALKPWVKWVLHDVPDLYCPSVSGANHCVWPGELKITTQSKGAAFVMRTYLDRETTVVLPGDRDHWPQEVRVSTPSTERGGMETNGMVIRQGDGTPAVRLKAGQHVISGNFQWSAAPEVLQIPATVGRVELVLANRTVTHPRMESGRLWLGDGASDVVDGQAESVKATVYRMVRDDVPTRVITRIQLNVSGRAREVSLGKILLDGSVPLRIESPIPARVPLDGEISVFVRPGSHVLEIEAVVTGTRPTLKVPAVTQPFYDPQEVWVWVPNEPIRSVRIDGVTGVDPERTSLPEDWKGHSTYLLSAGDEATLVELRRGLVESPPNLIYLKRDLWLDLDGRGYTIRDQVSGKMNQGWRMNLADGTLGRVTDDTSNVDLLITRATENGLGGVEIRSPELRFTAESRVDEGLSRLKIVGWDHDIQTLSATLRLPPGWMLVGGQGVDKMPGTWFESWRLWDFFFVLLVALAAGRLLGWGWTPLALITLVLSHGFDDAPAWSWVVLLATLALVRVVPDGKVRTAIIAIRILALIVLAIILAPFARDQLRWAIHPQVGEQNAFYHDSGFEHGFGGLERSMDFAAAPAPMEQAYEAEPMVKMDLEEDYREEKPKGYASRSDGSMVQKKVAQRQLQQVDPNAVVQTGFGVPTWGWSSWSLQWVGPVRKDHVVELWLLSPLVTGIVAFVRVGLLILLALLMMSLKDMSVSRNSPRKLAGVAGVLAVLLVIPGTIHAEELVDSPRPEILNQLRDRLIQKQQCDGECVVVSRADITVRDLRLTMKAEVFAQKDSGWHLPGPSDPVNIQRVLVDGQPTTQLRREPGGLTIVRLEEGRHLVEIEANLVSRNVLTIQFQEATRPRFVTFTSSDWTVDGVGPSGVPDSSIQLTRQSGAQAADVALATELPPWFFVERIFELGMPWQVRTIVTREDTVRPQLVKIPLNEGEKVITDGVRMEGNLALVDMPRGSGRLEFLSEIAIAPTLSFKAATEQPWTETWRVQCSQIWRCSFSDLPRIQDVYDNVYQPVWKPWPGEALEVTVGRPDATAGKAVTVDAVSYTVTPGKRLLRAVLRLTIRASSAGTYDVTLPEGAELQRVLEQDTVRTIRPKDGKVTLPIVPGSRDFVLEWQQPWERTFRERVPAVIIGSDAVNAETKIELGDERWLLWVSGPSWGPAILFWSHLILLMIIAVLLGRIPHLPIRTWEWLLLVIGLSQIPVVVGLPIVIWFVMLSWRKRHQVEPWWTFDLLQLFLVFLTFVAAGCLYSAIHTNLLFDVDMQVEGAMSSNRMLRWYVDQTESALPQPVMYSVPILVWRFLMLLWAFWLVSRVISWVRWGWTSFSTGGLWRPSPPRAPKQPRGPRGGVVMAESAPVAAEEPRGRTRTDVGAPRTDESSPAGLEPRRSEHGTLPGVAAPTKDEPNVQSPAKKADEDA